MTRIISNSHANTNGGFRTQLIVTSNSAQIHIKIFDSATRPVQFTYIYSRNHMASKILDSDDILQAETRVTNTRAR